MRRLAWRLGCLLLALVCLPGCRKTPPRQYAEVFAMDTVMSLTFYGSGIQPDALVDEITALEQAVSVTDPRSGIYALNRDGSAVLTADAAALLERALELCAASEGGLDITVYPAVRAWGFTTDACRVPDAAELERLLPRIDYTRVTLEDGVATVPDGVEVDLGSVAKGYLGDRLAQMLQGAGVASAILNLGGNVQTVGSRPDGTPWRVGIQDPQDPEAYLGVLSVEDQAVVTSGGYERFFTGEDGTVYWHILDPATARPARSGLRSVTVTGGDGARCDALSTALFVLGEARAVEYWRARRDFELVLVTDDGRVVLTPGAAACFEAATDAYRIETLPD